MLLQFPQMGKVYSYTRFSNEKQKEGNSIERQIAYAEEWAAENGMVLDKTLSMSDEGLSAFHQKHISTGKLGVFLKSVQDGRVPPGSVLIVEDLDRLSRAEPMVAQGQLAQLVSNGISVVTAIDNKIYSRESLKDNPMDLLYSLLKMIRANEESETKSDRVRKAIESQCKKWLEGTNRKRIRNGRDPAWVRWTGSQWELVPEEAARVRRIVELYMAGYGSDRITHILTDEGYPCPDISQSGNFYRFFTRKTHLLIGTKLMVVNGTEYRLEGYYPPLIDMETYRELIANSRARKRGGECAIPGIMNGGQLRCGYCGGAVCVQITTTNKDASSISDSQRRLRCVSRNCPTGSFRAVPFEKALVTWCSDQLHLNSLVGSDEISQLRSSVAEGKSAITDYDRQLDRLANAIATSDAPPATLTKKMRDIEMLKANLVHQLHVLEAKLVAAATVPTKEAAEEWRELRKAAIEDLDYDARIRLRSLINETFSKIVAYPHGTGPRMGRKWARLKTFEMVLVGKTGITRHIKFDHQGQLLEAKEESRPSRAA